jgi:hypothetical protein
MIALMTGAFFKLTEGEAANVAVLLWQNWKILSMWRYEEGVFEKEILGKPGSQIVENFVGQERTWKSVSFVDFCQFVSQVAFCSWKCPHWMLDFS